MNQKNIPGIVMLKAIILITLLSLTFGCLQTDKEVSIQKLVTDKEVYYSNETMLVSLEIFSEDDIKNVRVNVSGIENMFGRSLTSDVYVIFQGASSYGIPLTILIKPFVNEVWIGVILFSVGIILIAGSEMNLRRRREFE